MKVLKKIVLTGGPCAGKTSALSLIPEYFAKYGWKVVTLPEGATTLRLGGVFPDEFADELKFQEYLVSEQLARENVCEHFCAEMKAEKVLIVCDRGACDGKAYVPEGKFPEILRRLRLSETAVRDRYDAVFHLVTAADGAESAYTLSNNAARFEDARQAREADIRTQNAWVGHSHLRIIKNIGSFDDKMRMLMKEISTFLGEPEPCEIERKFLIRRPDLGMLRALPHCQEAEIMQTYLLAEEGMERRVRQRGLDGSYVFTKTTKRPTGDARKRYETEERIDEREYLQLLMQANLDFQPVHKTRFCVMDRASGHYFEIDIYPHEPDLAILEVELTSEDEEFVIPEFIEVVREVTSESGYRNQTLARSGGKFPR